MALRDLIPWMGPRSVPSRREGDWGPLLDFEDHMARLFDDFLRDWPWRELPERTRAYVPRLDVADAKDALAITVELPGMEEKDVEVTLTKDALTIRGEKTAECMEGEEGKAYYRRERTYGAFVRTIPLPPGIEADKAEATFKNGILSVRLPKSKEEVESVRRIAIKGEEKKETGKKE